MHGVLNEVLILDGLEKAERNVLPTLNNLLENREMSLQDFHSSALLYFSKPGETSTQVFVFRLFVPLNPLCSFRIASVFCRTAPF
jgi:hypothetical protein